MTNFKESDSSFYDQEYFIGMEFRYLSEAHGNKVKTFDRFIGDVKGKKILDLGCGGGIFSHILRQKGANVSGVDYSESAIDFARKRYPKVDFSVGSAYNLSMFKDNSFDIVTMMDIIEHLSEQKKALEEVRRVLKPGGLLVISTDLSDSRWSEGLFQRIFWFSMRFSKQGRAYRLIKETEARVPGKKHYNASHIGLLTFSDLRSAISSSGFKVLIQEVYPLTSVWWRDLIFKILPKEFRGEHQMLLAEKIN